MAEEANRLKSRFLSIVSHELRTPLNLISGLSRILLDEYAAGEQKQSGAETSFQEDLRRIFISSQHLDGLIRDVLDLASSDIGQLKLVCESLDLYEVLQAASVIGEQLARDKGLKWRAEIARDLPRVWGDRTRLRQVTLNLINNALKFTARGEIRLTALVKNEHVEVSVSDTGLGIPLHEQGVIFDEFRQSERTATRGYGGLGLGLAICKKLVEMHGGEIGVCSSGKEGEGSNFYFSLPVVDTQQTVEGALPSLTDQRILLLVKDRPGGEALMEDLLRRGHNVQCCVMETENDWLAVILRAAPDVVVLDLSLTSQRGWDILKVMKENPATKNIPVLFFSLNGGTGPGSLLEIDYLTKPLTTNAISEVLANHGLLNPEPGQGPKTILVVDDDPAMLHLYARILSEALPGHSLLQAGNGLEALQILRQESPALVLLDLMMPEMDGFCVLEEMRKLETTRNIPVVVVTGQALTREDLDRLNTGVVSVLGKGIFREEEILQHISKALERKRKPGSESQHIARKAMAYIHSNYADSISRSEVAAYVGLSERHLARCFQQEVGMSPITYLNRFRVRQAKALLDAGEKGITEIAVEVGFASSSYFTRVFRDEVGVSPRTYLRGQCKEPGNVR
jgi:CheY-like chemotaxis protein